ncbi:MAG: polysaccharide deacetylase family protein [Candidatus Limnocylindria bacterium]
MRVALTFDAEHPDRPTSGDHHGPVLDELARLEVRATFFLQGRWVEAHPQLAGRAAEDGHVVGNHGFYHVRMPLLSREGFEEDVREAERTILEATGVDPRPWLRFPFGAGADVADIVDRLPALGYRHVGWDVEVYEWEPGRTASEVAARVVAGVKTHGDGAIVLLHAWPDPVAPALGEVVERLRGDGARFVGIDELDVPPGLAPIALPHPAASMPTV